MGLLIPVVDHDFTNNQILNLKIIIVQGQLICSDIPNLK